MNPSTYMQLPLPTLPQTQALSSPTFKRPPLDGSVILPHVWDWHHDNSPDHPVIVYSDDTGQNTIIRMREVIRAIHRAAKHVRALFPSGGRRPVVGILAASGKSRHTL